MSKFIPLIAAFFLGLSAMAHAQRDFVVVELFTSQGCYSCPPADKILYELSQNDDVIALSMHVDYWDYLGWKDAFAIPKFGERQAKYNHRIRDRAMRVTPQMVINGIAEVAGGSKNSKRKIERIIAQQRQKAESVELDLVQNPNGLVVSNIAPIGADRSRADIFLVKYRPKSVVQIARGENAGKTLTYHNVVESFDKITMWNGRATEFEFELPEPGHYAVIVQERRFGPIIAARKLDWRPPS